MKTFVFTQKNSGVVIVITAEDFTEAEQILNDTVKDNYGWRVDNEEGEEDDETASCLK